MKPKKNLNPQLVRQASEVLRCIAHADRLRVVECLEGKSLSVSEIIRALGLDQVAVSKHLAVLKKGGIVKSKVQANYRYYSIAFPGVLKILECMRQCGGKTS
jgi:DNA-binding transcriptional ArsR family regulator